VMPVHDPDDDASAAYQGAYQGAYPGPAASQEAHEPNSDLQEDRYRPRTKGSSRGSVQSSPGNKSPGSRSRVSQWKEPTIMKPDFLPQGKLFSVPGPRYQLNPSSSSSSKVALWSHASTARFNEPFTGNVPTTLVLLCGFYGFLVCRRQRASARCIPAQGLPLREAI
jgi:hypothetical protein